jgi:hypothetical protein
MLAHVGSCPLSSLESDSPTGNRNRKLLASELPDRYPKRLGWLRSANLREVFLAVIRQDYLFISQRLRCPGIKNGPIPPHRTECHTVRGEALEIPDRGGHVFTAEAVEGPYEQEVELASCGTGEHRSELLSIFDALATILVLEVFADDRVAQAGTPSPQLQELVFRVLPPIVRRHSGVNGYPCTIISTPAPSSRTPSRNPIATPLAMKRSLCAQVRR